MTIPKKLKNSPLREVVFEFRFVPAFEAVGDVLPGVLYSLLKSDYPSVSPLPLAQVPRAIRDNNATIRYHPSHRLTGHKAMVQTGDRAITFNVLEYPGWQSVKERIEALLLAAKNTGFVKEPERFSIKYINLLDFAQPKEQFNLTNLRIEIGGKAPQDYGFKLRYEVPDESHITIIQIATNATVTVENKEYKGLLIDLDTIRDNLGPKFLDEPSELLEEAHRVCKVNFFSILSSDALKAMQPE